MVPYFVWNQLLGEVPGSQLMSGISAEESKDFFPVRLEDPVRGDVLWHEKQNTAANNYKMINWTPSPRPEPHVHSSPETRSDFLPLDQHHNGGGSDKVKQES